MVLDATVWYSVLIGAMGVCCGRVGATVLCSVGVGATAVTYVVLSSGELVRRAMVYGRDVVSVRMVDVGAEASVVLSSMGFVRRAVVDGSWSCVSKW